MLSLALAPTLSTGLTALAQTPPPAPAPTEESRASDAAAALDRADQLAREGRWKEAAAAYRRALDADQNSGQAWYAYGLALHHKGDLDAAIEAHKKAATFPGVRPVALYNLACAYALKGDAQRALATLDEAVDAGFNNPGLIGQDADLRSLRNEPAFKALVERLSRPADGPQLRHLDFWIGDWDVFSPAGQRLGANTITREEDGHVIRERWTSADGLTGQSINYYEPASAQWKQVWVSARGGIVEMAGALEGGAMRFKGRQISPQGRVELHKTTLTPLADGRVNQRIEQSQDGGETWYVAFEGVYVRKGSGGAAGR